MLWDWRRNTDAQRVREREDAEARRQAAADDKARRRALIEPAPIPVGLLSELKGGVYDCILCGGGSTFAQVRKRVSNRINRVRFAPITSRRDASGKLINSGRLVVRRGCIVLRDLGLLDLRNEVEPRTDFRVGGGRRRRGGNMYYTADVYRISISVCWGGLDADGRDRLRVFMIATRVFVNWVGYGMASGDGLLLQQRCFWDWDRSAAEIGDLNVNNVNGNVNNGNGNVNNGNGGNNVNVIVGNNVNENGDNNVNVNRGNNVNENGDNNNGNVAN